MRLGVHRGSAPQVTRSKPKSFQAATAIAIEGEPARVDVPDPALAGAWTHRDLDPRHPSVIEVSAIEDIGSRSSRRDESNKHDGTNHEASPSHEAAIFSNA